MATSTATVAPRLFPYKIVLPWFRQSAGKAKKQAQDEDWDTLQASDALAGFLNTATSGAVKDDHCAACDPRGRAASSKVMLDTVFVPFGLADPSLKDLRRCAFLHNSSTCCMSPQRSETTRSVDSPFVASETQHSKSRAFQRALLTRNHKDACICF